MAKNNNLVTLNASDYVFYKKKTPAEWEAFVAANKAVWEVTGETIRSTREKLKMTKKALAEAAGICVKTLTKLEKGQYIRRFATVSRSCLNALGVNALIEYMALEKIVSKLE